MPLYNGADHCVEAMSTVFAQTRLPDEVIVVDDGSDDRSAALLRSMDAPVPVKIEEQSNQGQSAARNAGIRLASGSLVAFLDQDDLWTPDHLERLCAVLEDDPTLAWVFSDFDEIDDMGRVVTRGYLAHHGVQTARRSLSEIFAADLMVLPSASVIRREALWAVGGFDPRLRGYEDEDLFIRMFRLGYRAACLPVSLTSYRVHVNGSSADASFQQSRVRQPASPKPCSIAGSQRRYHPMGIAGSSARHSSISAIVGSTPSQVLVPSLVVTRWSGSRSTDTTIGRRQGRGAATTG